MLQRTEQLRSCELFSGGWDRQNVIIYATVVLGHRFCLTFQSHFSIYKGCTGQHGGQCAVCLTDSWTRTTTVSLSQGSPGFTCSTCTPTFLDLKVFALRLRVVFPFTLNIHTVCSQRYSIENKRQKESLSGTYYFLPLPRLTSLMNIEHSNDVHRIWNTSLQSINIKSKSKSRALRTLWATMLHLQFFRL